MLASEFECHTGEDTKGIRMDLNSGDIIERIQIIPECRFEIKRKFIGNIIFNSHPH